MSDSDITCFHGIDLMNDFCVVCEIENDIEILKQAKKQEELIGEHCCPDWDFLFLKKGYVEFAYCTCRNYESK